MEASDWGVPVLPSTTSTGADVEGRSSVSVAVPLSYITEDGSDFILWVCKLI